MTDGPLTTQGILWERQCITYLGTRIYYTQANLLEGNVARAIRGLKRCIEFWGTLPLSVAGRVALLKMIALPRLLYYFRTLPIWSPVSVFKQLRSIIVGFLWASGRRRVALNIMMRPRSEGGLGVPDFETYYLAAQLQWLTQMVARTFRDQVDVDGNQTIRQTLSRLLLQLPLPSSSLT